MRSIKPFPGSDVIRIVNSSDKIRVPPVTELATSDPGSFSTGADSPVIADSSTDATPAITSPSAGITSPAITLTVSPWWRVVDDTSCSEPSGNNFRAIVSDFVDRKASA